MTEEVKIRYAIWHLDYLYRELSQLKEMMIDLLPKEDSTIVNSFIDAFNNQIEFNGKIDVEEIESIEQLDDSTKRIFQSGEQTREDTGNETSRTNED